MQSNITNNMLPRVVGILVATLIFACVLIPICNSLANSNEGGVAGDSWDEYPYYNVESREYFSLSKPIHITLDDLNKMAEDIPFDMEKVSESKDYSSMLPGIYLENDDMTISITPTIFFIDSNTPLKTVEIYIGDEGYLTGLNISGFDMFVTPEMEISGNLSVEEGADTTVIPITGSATIEIPSCFIDYFKYFDETDLGNDYDVLAKNTLICPEIRLPYELEITADVLNKYAENGEMAGENGDTWWWNWVSEVTDTVNGEIPQFSGYEVFAKQSPVDEKKVTYLSAQGEVMVAVAYSGYLINTSEAGSNGLSDFKLNIDRDCNVAMTLKGEHLSNIVELHTTIFTYIPSYVDLTEISVGYSESTGNNDSGSELGTVASTLVKLVPILVAVSIILAIATMFFVPKQE